MPHFECGVIDHSATYLRVFRDGYWLAQRATVLRQQAWAIAEHLNRMGFFFFSGTLESPTLIMQMTRLFSQASRPWAKQFNSRLESALAVFSSIVIMPTATATDSIAVIRLMLTASLWD
jgi:hypothetical protein